MTLTVQHDLASVAVRPKAKFDLAKSAEQAVAGF